MSENGRTVRVAIAGNPNTGKTTLLNRLAGSTFAVGNWPGVTVERKTGFVQFQGWRIELVDLPGLYTLEPLTEDERIARDYLLNERPDVILNVVETPRLERNLNLTVELAELGIPMVMALNMMDEAQRLGISVDVGKLYALSGIRAIPTNGRSGQGVRELLPAILEAHQRQQRPTLALIHDEDPLMANLRAAAELDAQSRRLGIAEGLYRAVVQRREAQAREFSAALDRVLLHPVLGLVAYLAIMYLFFKVSFDFSAPLMDWLDGFINGYVGQIAATALMQIGAPELVVRFMSEAVIGGVGFALTFLPLIAVMFFLLTLLGMSGYMARLPFLLDRFMRHLGLNGKAVIPLLLGLGCNVPAVMATRTMESPRDKLLVVMMIPFMSCPARLVIFSFFATLFFPQNAALVIFGMYALGVVVALFTSLLLQRALFKHESSAMLIELPPYRLPHLPTVGAIVWSHVREFLYRAGTVIFAVSVVIWSLIHLPPGATPAESIVARIGQAIAPAFAPLGLGDWRITTSLVPAFLAREVSLSFMATVTAAEEEASEERAFDFIAETQEQAEGLLRALGQSVSSLLNLNLQTLNVEEDEETAFLRDRVRALFTPASGLAFMIMLLLYNSCLAVYGVMDKEVGRKYALGFLAWSFVVAWVVAFVVYQVAQRVLA